MALISGRMTYSSFHITAFLIGPLLGVFSYSIRGEKVGSLENFHLYHEEPVGGVADRKNKQLGKKASGI